MTASCSRILPRTSQNKLIFGQDARLPYLDMTDDSLQTTTMAEKVALLDCSSDFTSAATQSDDSFYHLGALSSPVQSSLVLFSSSTFLDHPCEGSWNG